MTEVSINAPREYEPTFGDYVALMKPRVMSLVVFTALVGLLVAPVSLHPFEAFCAILFIAIGAGASGVVGCGAPSRSRASATVCMADRGWTMAG